MIQEFINFFRLSKDSTPISPPAQPKIFRIVMVDTGDSIYESEYGWQTFLYMHLAPGVVFDMMYNGKPSLFVVKTVYVDLTNRKYDQPKDVILIKVQKIA